MESLLSLAFENVASRDANKIRKGLRQIEGLLAQICLFGQMPTSSPTKRKSSMIHIPQQQQQQPPLLARSLDDLGQDLAFVEFFKLQDTFQWNVTTRLVECLERLLGARNSNQNDILLTSTLFLTQGMLLLHPASRSLFGREIYMNLILDLLDPSNNPVVLCSALSVLVTVLLDRPQNTRVFENVDGIATVASLFKSSGVHDDVRKKAVELLHFYLLPESPVGIDKSQANNGTARTIDGKFSDASSQSSASMNSTGPTRSKEEKRKLLQQYFYNFEEMEEPSLLQGVSIST